MLSLKPGLVGSHFKLFGSCDLDLDLMTFIYELDLCFLKIYLQTKHELFRSELTKLLKKLSYYEHTYVPKQPETLLCRFVGGTGDYMHLSF